MTNAVNGLDVIFLKNGKVTHLDVIYPYRYHITVSHLTIFVEKSHQGRSQWEFSLIFIWNPDYPLQRLRSTHIDMNDPHSDRQEHLARQYSGVDEGQRSPLQAIPPPPDHPRGGRRQKAQPKPDVENFGDELEVSNMKFQIWFQTIGEKHKGCGWVWVWIYLL